MKSRVNIFSCPKQLSRTKKMIETMICFLVQSISFHCNNSITLSRRTRIIPVTLTTKWYRVWVKSKFVSASHYHRYDFTQNTYFPHHMLHLTRINIGAEWCYVPVPLSIQKAPPKKQTHFIRYIGFYSDIQTKGKYRIAKKTFNMFVAICLMCKRVDWRKIIIGRWVCEDMVLT